MPKPGPLSKLSKEDIEKEMEKFIAMCIASEANPSLKPPSREERDWISELINPIVKAITVVSTSPKARMIANIFFGLKPPPYPAKMFSNEEEVEWIKQFNK